jgi:DNA-binding CsgD family transcriptional regulator/tetratricopeptide (TPR) repeat protein
MIRSDYRDRAAVSVDELPAALRVPSPFPFVGRQAELEKLRLLLPAAEGEGRRVVLLGGAPGSGKSRLVREFASQAAEAGALVLYGACDAVVHSPYGPFSQALEPITAIAEPDELRAALGTSAGELTRLLPSLGEVLGELAPPTRADPDTERHRLHTIVTDLLDWVSRRRPVVLVIEDGQWADAPTLLLLRHLAQAPWAGRVLLFATFRDTEAEVPEGLAQTLADLRRSDDVVRLSLTGLSDQEIGEFVVRVSDGRVGADMPELAQSIFDLTGGNAFLVCELWRALTETKVIEVIDGELRLAGSLAALGTPESVREVVNGRLARLAPATTALLELAATAGAEFDLAIVGRGSGFGERELVAPLDEAIRSGMIVELPGRQLSYRFTHELVRRAVYDRLPRVRRAELHLRVGEALEASIGRSPRILADLAHHFAAAAALGETKRAIDYNILAARAAADSLAFDDAAAMLEIALELGIEDAARRGAALLELGMARHRAGKAFEAVDALTAAAQLGRELEDHALLARAAIGYEEASWRPQTQSGVVELLEEATMALGEADSELRMGLLGALARALDMRGQQERAAIVRSNAVELARRLGDRLGLATMLVRSYWSRGTTPIEEIIEMLTEARAIGEELGDTELQAEAMSWRVPSFVAVADIASARNEVTAMRQVAEITRQPFNLHVAEHYGAAIALSDGQLDAAARMARSSEEAGRMLTGRDASGTYGIQMFSLRREQGRLAELASVIRILAGSERELGPWRPGLVSLLVELGMESEATRELARIATAGLEPLRESLWLASLTYITDACTALGNQAVAEMVYPELAPLAGTNVMVGHLVVYYGAADRYLGMLAATLGEWERAEEHFERALELNAIMDASTWLAHTQYEYARMLLLRGAERHDQAGALLAEADQLAATIGMGALRKRIAKLGAPHAGPPGLPDGLSAREAQILRLVARGLSNREIGAELFISEHTAANHMRSILRKTGCANRTEAASYAHRHALVDMRGPS